MATEEAQAYRRAIPESGSNFLRTLYGLLCCRLELYSKGHLKQALNECFSCETEVKSIIANDSPEKVSGSLVGFLMSVTSSNTS